MSEKKSIVKPSESHVMLRAVVLNKVNTCVLSNCFKKCFIFFILVLFLTCFKFKQIHLYSIILLQRYTR